MDPVSGAACALVTIGALNWGLVGLGWLFGGADWNVVHMLLGNWPTVEAVVYVLVGVAAIVKMFMCKSSCGHNTQKPMGM